MNFKLILPVLIFLVTSPVIACATKESSSGGLAVQEYGKTKEEARPMADTKQGWEVDWEKALITAMKEGKIVIYTVSTLAPSFKGLAPVVKDKFGLVLEIVSFSRGGEQSARLITERRAGIFVADITSTGMNTFFGDFEPAGIPTRLEPVLILPEILQKKNWYGGEIHWGNKERTVLNLLAYPSPVLTRNSDMVKKEEVTSYYDLLNPKWKGKIIMNDPTVAGTGIKSFSVLGWNILNLDFFRQLAKQEPTILRDQRMQVDWLARGKYALHLFPRSVDTLDYRDAGASIAFIQAKEGSYLSRGGGAVSIVDRAAHPNAAKIFLNFLFSKEGMTLISKIFQSQVSRIDVPTDFLGDDRKLQPGYYYFMEADTKEWIDRDPEYKKMAEEIFGHLIK